MMFGFIQPVHRRNFYKIVVCVDGCGYNYGYCKIMGREGDKER